VDSKRLSASEYIPIQYLSTIDDCGFSSFSDDTSTSRDTAFAKVRARVQGTKLAPVVSGVLGSRISCSSILRLWCAGIVLVFDWTGV